VDVLHVGVIKRLLVAICKKDLRLELLLTECIGRFLDCYLFLRQHVLDAKRIIPLKMTTEGILHFRRCIIVHAAVVIASR